MSEQADVTAHPEIYKPRVCWWTFKGRAPNIIQHICGAVATLRTVVKHSPTAVSMYLCDKHANKLKSLNYTVTVVTTPPSYPYATIKP